MTTLPPRTPSENSSTNTNSVWVVVPAYHEASVIASVIEEIRRAGYQNIIVVDDGSADQTCTVAQSCGVIALRHRLNRGKGAATKTGIEAAKLLGAEIIVTMDGDGQHDPTDIEKLVNPIRNRKAEVVLG